MRTVTVRSRLAWIAILATVVAGPAAAGESERSAYAPWERLPVLDDGRIKPADTLARQLVETVCGRESPRLTLPGEELREFNPSELLFGWIVEPERWEKVPFLIASNEDLRRELLELPIEDSHGVRLKFASPWEVLRAEKFHARWNSILEEQREARAAEKPFEPTRLDRAVNELAQAYAAYRCVSFRPGDPSGVRRRFLERLGEVAHAWQNLEPGMRQLPRPEGSTGPDEVAAVSDAMKLLLQLGLRGEEPPWIPLKDADDAVWKLRQAIARLPGRIDATVKQFSQPSSEISPADSERIRVRLRAMASAAGDLVRLAGELHLALYDNGHTMAIVPALNAAALEQDRDIKDQAQPWLSIQAVLFGSDELLRDYPKPELAALRRSFQEVVAACGTGEDAEQASRLGPAIERFVDAVRTLGQRIEPIRESLAIKHKDEALLEATRYPPPGLTDLEVRYNRLAPFMWTWALSLAGVAAFALALGRMRTPMFWLAMFLVAVGQGIGIYGLALRTAITGRAPVTNMFETVVFVAVAVALLGLWFALLPLTGRGLRAAWQWAAVPGTREVPVLGRDDLALWSEKAWRTGHWIFLAPRAVLAYFVFAACVLVPYGEGEASTAISLLPRTDAGASLPTVSDLTVWIVGLAVLALCVWYVPRAIVAAVLSLFTVPYVLATQGVRHPLAQVVGRRPFAMAGAVVAFFTAYLACYAPIFDQNISPLMPVLRHNFWLTSHVLTITASYGAGALAWALGNLALTYYLFGRYRNPVTDTLPADIVGEHRPAGNYEAPPEALPRRAPEICNTLGTYIYRSTQVAVLFLAAGTILGALWADVSWGRFWGWDPKEVWALVSLLIYLAVLHGRYAGWFGNFGLAVGSVLGATAILMAWYGVNYWIGSGKHSYGEGTGGLGWVFSAVVVNWAYVVAAAVRYHAEIRRHVAQ